MIPVLIGGGACLAVVLVIALSGGGSSRGSPRDPTPAPGAPASGAPTPARVTAAVPAATERPGKVAARPAPAIDAARIATAERHFEAAKQHWNEGQRARQAGDHTTYIRALQAAWEEVEKQRDAIRDYTDWYLEADLEGWAIPGEYDGLARRLDGFDSLAQMIKKNTQSR